MATYTKNAQGQAFVINGYAALVKSESSLVGYWRLGDAGSGGGHGTVISDWSGKGHDGTFSNVFGTTPNPTFQTTGLLVSDSNKSLTKSSANWQYVNVPHHSDFSYGDGPVTIELWFKRASASATKEVLYSKNPTSGGLEVGLNASNQIYFDVYGLAVIITGPAVTDTNKHHLVVTKNGATFDMYLDGTSVGTKNTNQTASSNTDPIHIGASADNGWDPFIGVIDEVAVYSSVLSSSTVTAHYNAGILGRVFAQSQADIKQTYRAYAQAGFTMPPYDTARIPSLQVFIDWDNDGTFDAADEVTDDLTSDGVSWSRGRNADFTADAVGSASFVLSNTAGTYSPALNANMVPGKPVFIKSTDYAGTVTPHFYGYIQQVRPDAKNYEVAIEAYDPRGAMGRANTTLPTRNRTHREIRLDALNAFGATWQNLMSFNPAFATNTTGWTASGGTTRSLTRVTNDNPPVTGVTTCATLVHTGISAYVTSYTVDESVAIGDIVHVSVWIKRVSGETYGDIAILNSAGTLISDAYGDNESLWQDSWTEYHYAVVINTAADGIALRIRHGVSTDGELKIGAIQVTKGVDAHAFHATGGGLGTLPKNLVNDPSFEIGLATTYWSKAASSFTVIGLFDPVAVESSAPSGNRHMIGYPSNTANSGFKYTGFGSRKFFANQPYVFSFYERGQYGSIEIEAGIGSNGTPTDYASVSYTNSTTWTQRHVHWTPTADRTDVILYVKSTGTSGGSTSIYIDGVAVHPGLTEYPYETDFASLASENGRAPSNASTGTVKSILDAVNSVTLTRHWVEATLTAPYWIYKTENLDEIKAKTSVEIFADGDFFAFTNFDMNDDAIVNVVSVTPGTKYIDSSGVVQTNSTVNTVYSSDGTSVTKHGRRDGTAVNSVLLENVWNGYVNVRTIQQTLADNIILLGATAHSRPVLTVINRFPSQFERELDDVITISFSRLGISSKTYYIVALSTTVGNAGKRWISNYTLEESVL